jgi:hypothetical protein
MNVMSAGPTLRALVAATVNRMLLQSRPPFDRGLGDPRRSGVFRDEVNGVALTTTNHVNVLDCDVESRLVWELTNPLWTLKFVERRRLEQDGSFERVAPYEVSLEGDLIDAARFLRLPRELFFSAVGGDGWTKAEITIEGLRWLDLPYGYDRNGLGVVLGLL